MELIENVTKKQQTAANPLNSVWVSASAGSGKTKVLTDRVLNLLLTDTVPERILCLTFTKAAAAEMSNRITSILKSWAIMDDEKLSKEIQKLRGFIPTQEILKKARCLFIKVIETPGGMKIMTIHSFCQSILSRFPIEAGVSPQFDVVDEEKAKKMMKLAMDSYFLNPSSEKDLAVLANYLNKTSIKKIFETILAKKALIEDWLNQDNFLETLKIKLNKYFNIQNYLSEKQIINEFYTEDEFNHLLQLTKNERKKIDGFDPHIFDNVNETINCYRNVEQTTALLRVIAYILNQYNQFKKDEMLLDYSDLISITKNLLAHSSMAQWILFKLDGGIDHILVDEAQDTNPDQWQIIRLLSEEFFSGYGKDEHCVRTIFAVGDKKQSIYSFQGADPSEFEKMHQFFEEKVKNSEKRFETVPMNISFRSTPAVLNLVNMVLKNKKAAHGVLNLNEDATHFPFRNQDAGLIEIWPLQTNENETIKENWEFPKSNNNISVITLLAQKIASQIKKMVHKEILPSEGRYIEPGDIMILVRQRNKIVPELVRALKEKDIPVAGVDRLILTDHIAVQDLISIAKFVLLPEDDLNLASLLKSPILRKNEDDLFKVAYNRGNKTLWERVQEFLPETAQYLTKMLNQADKMPVFEFFSYLLGPLKARSHFISRLGDEVNEALDEFLALTLNFEQTETPTLQNFLSWISSREVEIKRDLDQSGINAVRIMTVHGSKGLQGNIVFLPDTRSLPKTDTQFMLTETGLPLWIPNTKLRTSKIEELIEKYKDLTMEEYNRLLYVALTRAKDRLYICGWDKNSKEKLEKDKKSNGNWYDLILESIPNTIKPDTDGIIRISSPQIRTVEAKNIIQEEQSNIQIPDYALTQPIPETPLSKPLMPSKPDYDCFEATDVLGIDQAYAMRRGTFIHQLLQFLPDISPEKRMSVANKLKPDDIEIPENLFQLFENDAFSKLFGANSVAEIPVCGVLHGKVVSGQIDRLVIAENEVLIVDFKSGKHVPLSQEHVPLAYKKQMHAYKELLQNIFPDKTIKTYLLWTENLMLMELNK